MQTWLRTLVNSVPILQGLTPSLFLVRAEGPSFQSVENRSLADIAVADDAALEDLMLVIVSDSGRDFGARRVDKHYNKSIYSEQA